MAHDRTTEVRDAVGWRQAECDQARHRVPGRCHCRRWTRSGRRRQDAAVTPRDGGHQVGALFPSVLTPTWCSGTGRAAAEDESEPVAHSQLGGIARTESSDAGGDGSAERLERAGEGRAARSDRGQLCVERVRPAGRARAQLLGEFGRSPQPAPDGALWSTEPFGYPSVTVTASLRSQSVEHDLGGDPAARSPRWSAWRPLPQDAAPVPRRPRCRGSVDHPPIP